MDVCGFTRRETKSCGSLGSDITQINFFLVALSASQAPQMNLPDYDFPPYSAYKFFPATA
jgi:hypothetical protein